MIPLIILVIIVALFVYYYNSLIKLKNLALASWSDIDVQLKRRHNLIPNLIEIVKGYASHEKSTFENVVKARTRALSATTIDDKIRKEGELTGALRGLLAVAENYPELKANQNFLELQSQLDNIEKDIALARRYYNAVARDYNIKIESFPSNIVASLFNFKRMPFFEIGEENERGVPEVKF